MTMQLSVVLTSADFTVLENLASNWREPFSGAAELIRRKLDAATIMFPADVPTDVVTLGSRVRFRLGSEPSQECALVEDLSEDRSGMALALSSPVGLCLIGAAAGDILQVHVPDRAPEKLLIEAVIFQPEQKKIRPALRVVSRSEPLLAHNVFSFKQRQVPHVRAGGDDDPGPSAA